MMDKHKSHDPRTARPPLPGDIEKARTRKTRIELEENEDLEVDEGTEATAGSPESPDNTGAERKVVKRGTEFDDTQGNDEADPDAIDEEMCNQDSKGMKPRRKSPGRKAEDYAGGSSDFPQGSKDLASP
jgi:hypothetical protein